MSEESKSQSPKETRCILRSVPQEALRAVAVELTKLFPLDLPNAMNVARNAPLILLERLTSEQAHNVGTYVTRLRALGAEVELTSGPVGKLQVLRWPLLPDIAKRPATQMICPSCGARLGLDVIEAAPPLAAAPPAEAKPGPAAAAPEPQPEQPAAAAEEEEEEEVVLEPLDDEPAEEPPGRPEPAPAAAPPKSPPAPRPDQPPEAEEEAAEEPEEPAGEPVGGEGQCRVMLVGKIRGKKKRNAAELMAFYRGIKEDEAMAELNKRSVVTLARNLTDEEADRCKDEFGGIGVKVRITGGE